MHARSGEVTEFLERDLLPQAKSAFAEYQPADRAAIDNELAQVVEGVSKGHGAAALYATKEERLAELETAILRALAPLQCAGLSRRRPTFFFRYAGRATRLCRLRDLGPPVGAWVKADSVQVRRAGASADVGPDVCVRSGGVWMNA